MSLTMLSRSLSGCIQFNCNSCHYEVDGNTTLSDHMHLFHKQYNLFLTGILNLRTLNYSENPLEKDAKSVSDCDGEIKQKNQCDECHNEAMTKQLKRL